MVQYMVKNVRGDKMTKQELITYITNLDIKNVKVFSIVFIDNDDKQVTTNITL